MFKVIIALFLIFFSLVSFGSDTKNPAQCWNYIAGLQHVQNKKEPDFKKAIDVFSTCSLKCARCEFQLGISLLESEDKKEQIRGLQAIIKAAEDGYEPAKRTVERNGVKEQLAELEEPAADASRSLSLVNVPDIKKALVADYEMDENLDLYIEGLNKLYQGMQIVDYERPKAMNYFKESAKTCDIIEACYFMGAMQFLENKLKEAQSSYHAAMVGGSALAAFELGMMHFNKRDYEEARSCFKRYPHNIKMKAQLLEIDRLTSRRTAVLIRTSKTPAKLMLVPKKPVNRTAVRLNVNLINLERVQSFIKSLELYKKKDYVQALKEMQRYEKQSMHSAEYVYMMGHVHLKNGFNEGLDLLFNAASRGYKPAIFDLGLRYLTGDGVEKDLLAAARWFEKYPDDEKFKYHIGLALCQSIFPEDQEMGISLIEEARNYPLAQQALNNTIPMVHDEWGYYPAQAVGENK